MTRFAWLQSRTQTLALAAALVVLAVAAAVTGVHLAHLYDSLVRGCRTGCDLAVQQFLSHDHLLQSASPVVMRAFPAVLGVFWGTPLVARELETGTYRLVWTQSVSRTRWLLTRLAVVGLATVVLSALLTVTVTWWFRSIDAAGSNQYALFDERDLVPVAYALFAFALGAFVGAVLRRTVPAMATTLGVFVVARIGTSLWVRPHLLAAEHTTTSLLAARDVGFESSNGSPPTLVAHGSGPHQSWTLSSRLVDASGHHPTSSQVAAFVQQYCPGVGLPPQAPHDATTKRLADPEVFRSCQQQAAKAFHLVTTYQPAGRYWTFQWLETGIFLGLAALAVAGCWWWVTRRTT